MYIDRTSTGILQPVITLTGERDREIPEHTLVRTLVELLPGSHSKLWLLSPGEADDEAVLAAEAPAGPGQALYYAKHHGHNQVCQEELLQQGKLHTEHYSDDLQSSDIPPC